MFKIRPYNPEQASDLADVYKICLLTADNGDDASHLFKHPEMIGDYYGAPYCELEPTLVFLLEDAQGVCGYIIGALDTKTFNHHMNQTWLPKTRLKYPLPTDKTELNPKETWLSNLIYTDVEFDQQLADYPSHLHIDLLPRAQKQGQGKALMLVLWDALRKAGSKGVHLGVSTGNTNAIGFYNKIGFQNHLTFSDSLILVKEL